jgi:hypothetical protein
MLLPDWLQKLESARKEYNAFKEKGVFEEIDDANPDRSATFYHSLRSTPPNLIALVRTL